MPNEPIIDDLLREELRHFEHITLDVSNTLTNNNVRYTTTYSHPLRTLNNDFAQFAEEPILTTKRSGIEEKFSKGEISFSDAIVSLQRMGHSFENACAILEEVKIETDDDYRKVREYLNGNYVEGMSDSIVYQYFEKEKKTRYPVKGERRLLHKPKVGEKPTSSLVLNDLLTD